MSDPTRYEPRIIKLRTGDEALMYPVVDGAFVTFEALAEARADLAARIETAVGALYRLMRLHDGMDIQPDGEYLDRSAVLAIIREEAKRE